MRRLVILLALLLAACAASSSPSMVEAPPTPSETHAAPTLVPPTAAPPRGLVVDARQVIGPISPLVFGSNLGPWTSVPLDMRDEIGLAGLSFMRFPGGNWGDENDLRDYQIDPYIALCREFGFTPAISVRLLGGTPAQAAALVRYVNVEQGYNVRYWSIGNEPSLYATSRRQAGYGVDQYNTEWRAFAQAMRAVDPTILLVGPDIHQFDTSGGPRDPQGKAWMREFLLANGDLVDIVAFHRYPFPGGPGDPPPTADELRASSVEWDTLIPYLRAMIRETSGRDLPVAVTEISANWTGAARGEATPDSQLGAIWLADVLARLIRQRVDIVAQFAIHGPRREGWGLVEKYKVRPAYHVYTMFRQLGDTQVYAASDDPLVTLLAARRSDGALTIALVNVAVEPRTLPLSIVGFNPGGSAQLWRLDSAHAGEQLDPLALTAPATIVLPSESFTLLVIPPAGL